MPKNRLPAEVAIELGLDEPDDAAGLKQRVARALGVTESDIPELTLLRRSLDARRGRVRFHLLFALAGPDQEPPTITQPISSARFIWTLCPWQRAQVVSSDERWITKKSRKKATVRVGDHLPAVVA